MINRCKHLMYMAMKTCHVHGDSPHHSANQPTIPIMTSTFFSLHHSIISMHLHFKYLITIYGQTSSVQQVPKEPCTWQGTPNVQLKDVGAHVKYKEYVTLGAISTRKFRVSRSLSFIAFLRPTGQEITSSVGNTPENCWLTSDDFSVLRVSCCLMSVQ